MNILKPYGSLLMTMICFFVLGGYASSEFRYNEHIDLYRWVITCLFTIFFFKQLFN
jgi:hypothetical protein